MRIIREANRAKGHDGGGRGVLGLDSMTYRVFFLYFVLILGADSGGLEVGTDGLVFFLTS